MIRAVVFDLGDVLASPPDLLPRLAQRIGCDVDELRSNYWNDRAEYDGGASALSYWGPLLEALGREADADLAHELAELDSMVWAQLRPKAWEILRDCRAAGITVAVLSNSPHAMQAVAATADWRGDVDKLFISATLGVMKPDLEIYRRVSTALGLGGADLAFIDDKQANVDAATRLGWQTHLWVDDADTRLWLERLHVL